MKALSIFRTNAHTKKGVTYLAVVAASLGLVPLAHHTSIALPAEQDARRPILTRSFGWGFAASFALHCNLYVLSVIMTTHCMERYGPTSPRRRSPPASSPSAAWGGRFLGGPVTDRLGLVPIAILGFSLTAASSLLYLVAGDIHAVIAIRLCHGLFYGVASTTVTSMASAQVPEELHGEGMGYFMLSVTLASAVGPLVGIALMGSANYAALLLLAAGLAAAGFASTLLCGPTAGQEELGRELEDLESLEPDAPPRGGLLPRRRAPAAHVPGSRAVPRALCAARGRRHLHQLPGVRRGVRLSRPLCPAGPPHGRRRLLLPRLRGAHARLEALHGQDPRPPP